MPTNDPKKAAEDRRITRMHQMEMMEAAARGTAPSMQLDTSQVTPPTSGLRSRNTSTASLEARRFLTEEEDGYANNPGGNSNFQMGPTGTRGTFTGATSLFNQRDLYGVDQSVNLMDPDAESYTPAAAGKRSSSFVDIFIGGAGTTSGGGGARGRGNVQTTWQQSMGGRLLILCIFVSFGVVLAMSASFLLQEEPQGNSGGPLGNFVKTGIRYEDVKTVLLLTSASHTEYLTDKSTSAYHALRWVTMTDPAQVEADDPALLARFSLASFYYATHPDDAAAHSSGEEPDIDSGWQKDENWMSGKSVCQWFGVDCEAVLGNGFRDVVHLNLTSNDVTGNIPLELRSLTNMIILDLSSNKLEGTIPAQVCRMDQIEYLLLQNNQLSGTIPAQISMMEGAYEIYLTNNAFQGTIPAAISKLTNLRALNLAENAFEGSIPDMTALKELNHLSLEDNSLTGVIPISIAKLTNLHDLRLNKNQLTGGFITELANNKKLRLLYLGHNNFQGEVPNIFDDLHTLTDLELHYNKFTGTLPMTMQKLTSLRRLTIDYNKFKGSIPSEFSKMTDLEAIGMHHCDLVGSIPTEFGILTNLVHIYLNHNFFQNSLPTQFSKLTKVKDLFLEHNAFKGSIPTEVAKMTSLENLRIFENNLITGTMPSGICDLKDKNLVTLEADCKNKLVCDCCTKCY